MATPGQLQVNIFNEFQNSKKFCFAYLDDKYNYLFVSQGYSDLLSKLPGELLEKNHFDLFPNKMMHKIFDDIKSRNISKKLNAIPSNDLSLLSSETQFWDWEVNPGKEMGGITISLVDVTEQ
ncbi:MAG: hypothetical protein ACI857_002079, partial [Arenicella sp.]